MFLSRFFHQLLWQCRVFQLTQPGAASGSTDLLPAPSPSTNWTASLLTDSGRESDLIYRFDGHQAANVPDHVVPQNLTDQFTIATWMKHGPSPGLRAEKETLLCNSDKTGEEKVSDVLTVVSVYIIFFHSCTHWQHISIILGKLFVSNFFESFINFWKGLQVYIVKYSLLGMTHAAITLWPQQQRRQNHINLKIEIILNPLPSP